MKARAAALGLLLAAAPVLAQEGAPGGLRPAYMGAQAGSQLTGAFASTVTLIPEREELEKEADEARIRLGPLKLRPQLSIGNFGYTNNFFGETDADRQDDYTGSVTGGVRAIVPVGGRVFLRGSVLPTYTWYARHVDRRTFGGTYEASALFYLSRFSFHLTGGSFKQTVGLSSEVEQPVEQKVLSGRLLGQWEFGSRMALVGDVNVSRRRLGGKGLSDADRQTLAGLDGTDTVWSVGVRRKVGSRLLLGVSYERGNLTFVNEGTLRDATSEGVMGSAFLDRSRLDVNVYAGYRKLRPAAGSSFAGYDGPSGGANVSWALSRLFSLNVFARSNLVSSNYGESTMYDERRVGGGLGFSPRVVSLVVAYEVGTNKYVAPSTQADGSAVRRNDDVKTVRGTLRGHVGRLLTLGVEASESRYESNLPGFDRSIFRVGTTIGFGATGNVDILR